MPVEYSKDLFKLFKEKGLNNPRGVYSRAKFGTDLISPLSNKDILKHQAWAAKGRKSLGWPEPKSFKRGGKIKKTGVYKLHQGEMVVSKEQKKQITKMLKKKGRK